MKVKYKEKIGNKTIIRFITDAVIDSEETKKGISTMVKPGMSEKEIEDIYNANLAYAKVGGEADLISDELGEQLQKKFDEMGERKLLLDSGEYIDDYRGVEYLIKTSGKWVKVKIEGVGEAPPSEAVLQEDLSQEQREEIATQEEADRIAALTPEQKAEELRKSLHVLAREALSMEAESELLGETFNKQAWLQSKRDELERLYA